MYTGIQSLTSEQIVQTLMVETSAAFVIFVCRIFNDQPHHPRRQRHRMLYLCDSTVALIWIIIISLFTSYFVRVFVSFVLFDLA